MYSSSSTSTISLIDRRQAVPAQGHTVLLYHRAYDRAFDRAFDRAYLMGIYIHRTLSEPSVLSPSVLSELKPLELYREPVRKVELR